MRYNKQRKKVQVNCYGPIAFGKQYESYWEDVWIRYKIRPGKSFHIWFTFISYPDLLSNLELDLELEKDNPDLSWAEGIDKYKSIIKILETNEFYYDEKLTDFYIKYKCVNRQVVEKILNWFIESKGYRNIKHCWKIPKILVTPVSMFKGESEENEYVERLS